MWYCFSFVVIKWFEFFCSQEELVKLRAATIAPTVGQSTTSGDDNDELIRLRRQLEEKELEVKVGGAMGREWVGPWVESGRGNCP